MTDRVLSGVDTVGPERGSATAKALLAHLKPVSTQQGEPDKSRYVFRAQQPAGATTLSTLCVNDNDTSDGEPVIERDTLVDSGASKAKQAHAVFKLIRCAKSGLCSAVLCSKLVKL